ncbi:MAG: DUF3106 domain-containing protein [Pseudomonadota bacterium]
MGEVNQRNDRFVTAIRAVGCIFCIFGALSTSVIAQNLAVEPLMPASAAKLPSATAAVKNSDSPKTPSKPEWQDLTPQQQISLNPLRAIWNTLQEGHKRKWIALSVNYPTLAPAEQEKMHSRMSEWAALSPQQRAQARLNFARTKQLTPTQKTATWQAYQALSPEEKQKLAISATPKPAGAAAAVKPVPTLKLAIVPALKHTPKQIPKTAAANNGINRKTLLPQAPPRTEPATAPKN